MSARHAPAHRSIPVLGALAVAALIAASPAAASLLALTVKPIGAPSLAAVAPEQSVEPAVAPASPTSLAGQSVQPDTAMLIWRDTSNNETGFIVEAKTAGDPSFAPLGDPLPANTTSAEVVGLSSGVTYVFRVRAMNSSGNSAPSNEATLTALASSDCVPSATVMCLHNDEFRVQALFVTSGGLSGEAHAVELVADSGYLWFFAASNIEVVVKVLDGCTSNSHFWVFAGGLTDVRVLLTVTDTVAEISRNYDNPLGRAFLPIQDTSAFATCAP